MTGIHRTPAPTAHAPVFERVLVGVDGTDAGFEACRQAAVLAEPDATVEAVAVVHLSDAILVGLGGAAIASDTLRQEAETALAEAMRILGARTEPKFVNGFTTEALLREARAFGATAFAIGSHGHRRLTEILLGGVAGEIIHSAPCSVLVARPPRAGMSFPGPIVVGIDGSGHSTAALAAATELAARFAVPLDVVVATEGRHLDLALALAQSQHARVVEAPPVDALVAASGEAGLVVVGSRGVHGLEALGSVSERVAHRAACSVLVVRPAEPA